MAPAAFVFLAAAPLSRPFSGVPMDAPPAGHHESRHVDNGEHGHDGRRDDADFSHWLPSVVWRVGRSDFISATMVEQMSLTSSGVASFGATHGSPQSSHGSSMWAIFGVLVMTVSG